MSVVPHRERHFSQHHVQNLKLKGLCCCFLSPWNEHLFR